MKHKTFAFRGPRGSRRLAGLVSANALPPVVRLRVPATHLAITERLHEGIPQSVRYKLHTPVQSGSVISCGYRYLHR